MPQRIRAWTIGCALSLLLVSAAAGAAAKVHVINLGKWMAVTWTAGMEQKPATIKIRALIVDGRVKEYTLGAPHDVTDRLFVVRRVFRANDSLPEDAGPRWQWQKGGWLLVDRVTGRISPLTLPDFDPFYSAASWYRDYVAYCGIADDGKKTYAIVAQLTRRKPVLKKEIGSGPVEDAGPDSACPSPVWQRSPVRVSFDPPATARQTFSIRGHVVDVVSEDEEDETK